MENLEERLKELLSVIGELDPLGSIDIHEDIINYIKNFASYGSYSVQSRIREAMCSRLSITHDQLAYALEFDKGSLRDFLSKNQDKLRHRLQTGDSWIDLYTEYTNNNEAPELFHFWVAVTVIGAVLSRNVYFEKDYYRVYPPHFTILVAPTGKCRKSVSMEIGIDLLRQVENINIIAEKITPEALIAALHLTKMRQKKLYVDSTGVIHAPELAIFLGRQKYNEGLVAMLTGLADCPSKWTYRTKAGGSVTLENVALTLLGASTADWIVEALPPSVFGGGFMSRCIFVAQEESKRVFPFPKIIRTNLRELLISKLRSYQDLSGQFSFTTEAKSIYENWYAKNRSIYIEDKKLAGYFERKPDHVIRLSMILAVSEEGSLTINKHILEVALERLTELEKYMPDAFTEIESSPIGRDHTRILRMLSKAQGHEMSHSDLLRRNYHYGVTGRKLREMIDTLTEAGFITMVQTKPMRYRLLRGE